MGINFTAAEIGKRALRSAQLGMTITGQNIANVNTPGYTRQTVQLPPLGSGLRPGTGVNPDGITALRDQFAESRLQAETGLSGRLEARRDALQPIDSIFNDANNGGGVQAALTGFFGAFRDLEAQPNSVPLRLALTNKAEVLTSSFHASRARLDQTFTDNNQTLLNGVDKVNSLSKELADLNVQVSLAENTGDNTNPLRDQRNEVAKQLAELTGARAVDAGDGTITVTLANGRPLVVGPEVTELTTSTTPPSGKINVYHEGELAQFASGKLVGLSEAIDSVEGYITQLDDLAASVAARVNTVHATGQDLDGNNAGDLFTDGGFGTVDAENITLNPTVKANPRLIATALQGTGSGDAQVARSIAGLLQDKSSTIGATTDSFESFYATLVTEAGSDLSSTEEALATQNLILAQAQSQRDSVSGVSLDEEAVSMLQYQRAYEAAARFLKVTDEMTQTILQLAQ